MARGGRLAVGPGLRVGVARLGNWFHHMVESHTMLHRRRETAAGRAGDPLPSLADAGLDLRRPVRERRDHAHPCRLQLYRRVSKVRAASRSSKAFPPAMISVPGRSPAVLINTLDQTGARVGMYRMAATVPLYARPVGRGEQRAGMRSETAARLRPAEATAIEETTEERSRRSSGV